MTPVTVFCETLCVKVTAMGHPMSKTLARKLMLMFARMLIVAPVVLLGGLVSAHEVQPVRQILNLGQGNYESVITVRNTRNRDLTVEMVALRRVVAKRIDDPRIALTREPAKIPIFAYSSRVIDSKARPVMKIETVKPMPPRAAIPQT